jgi:anti-sigma regulatory factor (Ser/Thr protein kinase)
MPTDISLLRRCRDQEIAIARLMDDSQLLRDENADLLAQLEVARRPLVAANAIDRLEATPPVGAATPAAARRQRSLVASGIDRLEATLPVSPTAPVTARATLTRWLSGHVPLEVLEDARLLASELISNSLLRPDISEDDLLRLAVELRGGALRVEVRDPGTTGVDAEPDRERSGALVLQLVDEIATRWGVNRTGGTQVWFEVDAVVADGLA